jgi:hypothetical protein
MTMNNYIASCYFFTPATHSKTMMSNRVTQCYFVSPATHGKKDNEQLCCLLSLFPAYKMMTRNARCRFFPPL